MFIKAQTGFLHIKKDIFSDLKDNLSNLLRKFRRNRCNAEDAELRAINFVARKMRKFAPTRKPFALETLPITEDFRSSFDWSGMGVMNNCGYKK